ncbi:DUF4962 domain-containing protein [Clostridium sp. MCC353]|uniref:DUF4962 domain-containing protein n=1 Tax=Clostridium sp. MCC353 TaxID=2592646 RepID=UPI001C038C88|nr:DUF4962 domain-containing protein [Clostridium sp. MCC353]
MNKLVFIGDLTPYLAETAGKRKKQYERLLEQADRYQTVVLPDVHPKESTTYMGIAIVNLALAYRLSGEARYLKEAKRFMNAVLSYEKWGNAHLVNVDLSASWILFGLSLGYDWLKNDLSEEERARVSQKISRHAGIIYEYKKDTYGKGWSTNFYQNHNWINMTGLAAAGYALAGEDENASVYTEEAKNNFARVFSYLAEDGSNYEGVPYWRYGGMWLFVYAHLLKIQEGTDYFKTSSYLKNTFYYRLYQSCGDLKQQLNFGDSHDRYSGHPACVYYKTAAEYGDGFAQTFGNLVTDEFLMEEAANSKIKPGILPEAAFEFLWYDPEVEEKDLSLLPKVRYFEDLGLLSIRENWSRDSKVFTIKCGYPGGKKQWMTGFKLLREEGLDCLSLSHHHPDNLSYLFARGSEYLTCEDGYNRNIMPDHHNVILADGLLTDASDVNDVYVKSVKMRMEQEGEAFDEMEYGGRVTHMEEDGSVVVYRGETSGIYPKALEMKEVSRLFFTDGLTFWVFADVCRSEKPHRYQLISNTDREAEEVEKNSFRYPMDTGTVSYRVFSDKEIKAKQYGQEVVSVMTTQEPDKVCKTSIKTLAMESASMEKEQIFFECFTFEEENTEVLWTDSVLTVKHGDKKYDFSWGPFPENSNKDVTPVRIRVCGQGGAVKEYLA